MASSAFTAETSGATPPQSILQREGSNISFFNDADDSLMNVRELPYCRRTTIRERTVFGDDVEKLVVPLLVPSHTFHEPVALLDVVSMKCGSC